MDAGEASAITLALETENALLIIDEKKGRRIAASPHINIMGTLKILLIAKRNNIIPSVKDTIKLLQNHSFRFSKAVVDEILILANKN